MAFDVVTAKQGKQHVTAEQQAMLHAGMLGKGRYRLDVSGGLACSMTDPNTLTVDTGGLVVDGRWVVNENQTSFAIANGSQSAFRHDLAVLKIATDASTGVTTIEEKVLQGTSATTAAGAKDPAYDAGDLLGGLTATVPIARVKLDGLTPTCEELLPSVADLRTLAEQTKKLGDSVSQSLFKTVKYTSPKTSVATQEVLEYNGTLKTIAGYTPVGIVEANTNHDWSFCLMRATLNDASSFTCTWMNLNKGTWPGSVGYVTVLYIRS